MFIIERCKREKYIEAWNYMYKHNKEGFNSELYNGVNPSLNKKPLGTETDNFCVVAYDSSIDCSSEGFNLGYPVGIFSFVVTPAKIIGKQYVVDNRYGRKGIGRAFFLSVKNVLLKMGLIGIILDVLIVLLVFIRNILVLNLIIVMKNMICSNLMYV